MKFFYEKVDRIRANILICESKMKISSQKDHQFLGKCSEKCSSYSYRIKFLDADVTTIKNPEVKSSRLIRLSHR